MTEVPEALLAASPEARQIGLQPHTLNVAVTGYDKLRLEEQAVADGCSVSDIIRSAMQNAFTEYDEGHDGRLGTEAVLTLEFVADREARRAVTREQPPAVPSE